MSAPLLPDPPEPVPKDEVAAVLDEAVMRARGGPLAPSRVSGRDLAAALAFAGLRVVRAPDGRQLTF